METSKTDLGGVGTLKLKDTLRVVDERVAPLGPFAGSVLVDMQEQIELLHEELWEQLDAEGIGTVRVYERAEWTGVFTFEVEVHLQVAGFYAAKDKTPEEVQASAIHVFYVVAGLIGLALVGYSIGRSADVVETVFSPENRGLANVFGVVLFIASLAFLVYQMRKYRSLGKAIGAT